MYLIVKFPNYNRTYDQINQIEKCIRALYRELVLFLRSKNSFSYIPENESEQDILGWNMSIIYLSYDHYNLYKLIPQHPNG